MASPTSAPPTSAGGGTVPRVVATSPTPVSMVQPTTTATGNRKRNRKKGATTTTRVVRKKKAAQGAAAGGTAGAEPGGERPASSCRDRSGTLLGVGSDGPGRSGEVGHVARRDLLALVTAGTLGRAPVVVIPIATLLLVADRSTLTLGGFASGAASLGAGVGGLLIGRRLDGSAARWVLTLLAVLHIPAIALFIGVAGSTNRLVLSGAGLVAGITVPPIGPVVRARLAGLAADAPPAELRRVFAWDSLSVELSWIGAPLLVSLAIVIGGPALAVAISPVLAAIGIASITTGSMSAARAEPADVRWLTPAMIRLALAFGIMGIGWRIVTIGVTEIARAEGGDRWTGRSSPCGPSAAPSVPGWRPVVTCRASWCSAHWSA